MNYANILNGVDDVITQEPDITSATPENETLDIVGQECEQEPEMLSGVVVDCTKLNVRKAPSASADIVCTIPRGTEVAVFEEGSTDEFYKVCTASGVEGFCMTKYINI